MLWTPEIPEWDSSVGLALSCLVSVTRLISPHWDGCWHTWWGRRGSHVDPERHQLQWLCYTLGCKGWLCISLVAEKPPGKAKPQPAARCDRSCQGNTSCSPMLSTLGAILLPCLLPIVTSEMSWTKVSWGSGCKGPLLWASYPRSTVLSPVKSIGTGCLWAAHTYTHTHTCAFFLSGK